MLDKIVLDLETKNSFADVGGKQNLHKLQISLIGVYSYKRDEYLAFTEKEFHLFEKLLHESGVIVGFSIYNFDLPLIEKHFNYKFDDHIVLDILKEIEEKRGHKISLDELALANIGQGKNGNGLEAIQLYKEGKIEELKKYCLNDVKITKELYELILKKDHLIIPSKFHAPVKVPFNWLSLHRELEKKLEELEKKRFATPSQNSLF
ncbi:MAG: ribonuclease H-like domain-containing protein [Minisyncoccia bacterium]